MPGPKCSGIKKVAPSKLTYQFPTAEEAAKNDHQYYINIKNSFPAKEGEPALTSAHVSVRKSKKKAATISEQTHLTVFRGGKKYHVYFVPGPTRYDLKARQAFGETGISSQDTLFKSTTQIMELATAVMGDMLNAGYLPKPKLA